MKALAGIKMSFELQRLVQKVCDLSIQLRNLHFKLLLTGIY